MKEDQLVPYNEYPHAFYYYEQFFFARIYPNWKVLCLIGRMLDPKSLWAILCAKAEKDCRKEAK